MDDYDDLNLIVFEKEKCDVNEDLKKYLILNDYEFKYINTLKTLLKSILITIINYFFIYILNFNKLLDNKKLILFNFTTLMIINYILIYIIF